MRSPSAAQVEVDVVEPAITVVPAKRARPGSSTWTSLPRQALWLGLESWVGTIRTRVGTPGRPANTLASGAAASWTTSASGWP